MANFSGDSGDNSIAGTADSDFIDVSQGGDDTVQAGDGDDFITFGGAYTSGDVVDGGEGSDSVQLHGDYAHATAVDFTNVEVLFLVGAGLDYRLTLAADCFAVAGGFAIHADGLDDTGSVNLNLTADSAGQTINIYNDMAAFNIKGGAANERLQFASAADGVSGSFSGGAGDDYVFLQSTELGALKLNGGKGFDILELVVGGDWHFAPATLKLFERIDLVVDADFSLTMSDANVARGHSLTIDAHFLPSTDSLVFDGSAETNGAYAVIGTAGDDSITGGASGDTLTGGGGADHFIYADVSQSSGHHKQFDLITDLDASDIIDLSAIDANSGKAGNQAFHIVGHFTGAAGQLVLSYSAGKDLTTLAGDVDGDGKADISIHISGDHTDFSNFVL